jgi:hypothetical protein
VRQFVPLAMTDGMNGLHFIRFSTNLVLREVIVGDRCDLSRRDLDVALGNLSRQVKVSKARLSFKRFEVVRQRNKDLWL